METIVYREHDLDVSLETHLSKARPLVIALEPFSGECRIPLSISEGEGFMGLCAHLSEGEKPVTVPHYTSCFSEIPETYFLLTHDANGFTAYFCLSHHDLQVTLTSNGNRGLALRVLSGSSRQSSKQRNLLFCVRGDNLHQTVNFTMRLALKLAGGMGKLSEEKPPLPQWLGKLGWESGASFGKEVTHEKVLNAIWSIRQLGYQPGFVVIDEGWQREAPNDKDKHCRPSMLSFDADPVRFPLGLEGLVEDLHRAGVQHVGMNHPMMGSGGGIHPQLARKYDLPPDEDGRYFLGYDLGRTFHFFHDFYGYLRERGVTFIKVGDQNNAKNFCRRGMDATLLYRNLQSAIQAAASIQFNSSHFNSECLRNENLFYWTTSCIASAADDLDTQNFNGAKRAIRDLLINSLWLQHLMEPDFNAWTTNLEQSPTLAMFHALTGSTNVISDAPGNHDAQLMHRMILPSGKVLRAEKPLTLCYDSVFVNPLEELKVYKAFTFKEGNGIIGAFNLLNKKRTLHGTVSPSDVEGLVGETFAIFSHHNGFVGVVEKTESLPVTLKPNQSDIFTIAPIKEGVALIGCYPFYLPPGPITEVNLEEESMHISSLVTAPMIMYCERQVLEIRRNGQTIPWEYDQVRKVLTVDSRSNLLEIPSIYSIVFE